jgi:hypothetical protein
MTGTTLEDSSGFMPEWKQVREGLLAEIERLKASEKEQRLKMETTLQREREILRQKEVIYRYLYIQYNVLTVCCRKT